MGKNKGGDANFSNRACRKFKDNQKAHLISQMEVFEILQEDMSTILKQISDNLNRVNGAKYPTYTVQMFSNLSVPLYFSEFIKDHVKPNFKKGKIKTDLSDDEIHALKHLLADIYKRSATGVYQAQLMEAEERNKYLAKSFEQLDPKRRKAARKLGLSKKDTRDLLIQTYGDPVRNFRFVCRLFDKSNVSEKEKLNILRKLYKKRFVDAVGAALATEGNKSDCLYMLFQFVDDKKAKKRAPYIRAYAEAFKQTETHYGQINNAFKHKNRKIIRELKEVDIGYKKAFKNLWGEKKENKERRDAEQLRDYIASNRKKLDAGLQKPGAPKQSHQQ